MDNPFKLLVLPGDGIGPEVVSVALRVFEFLCKLEHLYADNALNQMMQRPARFDVVIADSIFGDLASDLVASYAGSLGMLPSASLQGLNSGRPAIFEPVHGTEQIGEKIISALN